MLISLLPLLILFAFSILSALPNIFAEPSIPDPRFAFVPDSRYNTERHTSGLKIRYHVNNAEFSQHPQIAAELAAQASGNQRGARNGVLRRFEGNVERIYTQELYGQCQRGIDRRERRKNAEIGLLGIGTDWGRVREIELEKVESCEELKRLQVLK
jgi:DnaJ homolog subfamily B member 12